MPQQQQQQDDTNHREMPQRRPEQTETEAERERERGTTWRELKHMQTKVNQSILELTNCVKQYYE